MIKDLAMSDMKEEFGMEYLDDQAFPSSSITPPPPSSRRNSARSAKKRPTVPQCLEVLTERGDHLHRSRQRIQETRLMVEESELEASRLKVKLTRRQLQDQAKLSKLTQKKLEAYTAMANYFSSAQKLLPKNVADNVVEEQALDPLALVVLNIPE
ncbi:hypothetical protein GWK47_009545 [Chionoecetes opilio]|uniref:Uncharacterized protein n=1 Tax=Chionoecetes opilio TaxID=41210 RepID=A0A8J4Y3D6_CHIOP|nr:hypothetical protein GWK47_009545 [Chionoecetes opilio]